MDKDYEWMWSKESMVILMHACTYTGTSGVQKPTLAVDHQGNGIPSFFFLKICILFIYLLTFLLKIFIQSISIIFFSSLILPSHPALWPFFLFQNNKQGSKETSNNQNPKNTHTLANNSQNHKIEKQREAQQLLALMTVEKQVVLVLAVRLQLSAMVWNTDQKS